MPVNQTSSNQLTLFSLLDESLVDERTVNQIRHSLNSMATRDIAHYIESSPTKVRHLLWELVDAEVEGDVFSYLNEDLQKEFLRDMSSEEMAALVVGLDTDDVADVLQQLPERVIPRVLEAMDNQDRLRVESVLSYDEDSAGGLMNTDTITVRPDLTIDVILRYLRRHEEIPDVTDSLFVVNRRDIFLGTLPLARILTALPNTTVREIMDTDTEAIPASTASSRVAQMFERHDWVSAPVVDDEGKLLGRITIDDVVDVIIEDAEHSLFGLAGLSDEEQTFTSVRRTAPRRAIWLGINLATAVLASIVINLFESTLDKVVALAILMPIEGAFK